MKKFVDGLLTGLIVPLAALMALVIIGGQFANADPQQWCGQAECWSLSIPWYWLLAVSLSSFGWISVGWNRRDLGRFKDRIDAAIYKPVIWTTKFLISSIKLAVHLVITVLLLPLRLPMRLINSFGGWIVSRIKNARRQVNDHPILSFILLWLGYRWFRSDD